MRENHITVFRERALLVGALRLHTQNYSEHESLGELAALADTAGSVVVERVVQKRQMPTPNYFIGRGKVEELAGQVRGQKIDVVIFDADLTPAQVRNLEMAVGVKVIDRTELILDIFATHARTKEAKLQVELAQLEYALPRLRRMWTHLSRQDGVAGIAQRGLGEKQIEVDRRLARRRITDLRREIRDIEEHKQREVAVRAENYTIALVGYTNAGKSTLMRALTGADVYIDDKLFSTLDTKTRTWTLKSGLSVLLSDTVGFIRSLPHHLVASFHATLAEVTSANLLLHVVDASHPQALEQITAVEAVLAELGCDQSQTLILLNKTDRLKDHLELHLLQKCYPNSLPISAKDKTGLERLEKQVELLLSERMEELDLLLPLSEGKLLSELLERGYVLSQRYDNDAVHLRARIPQRELHKVRPFYTSAAAVPT